MLLASHLGDSSVFVFESMLKQVVRGVLLVLVASEVSLGSLVLGETQSHEPFDGSHFFGRDSDGSRRKSSSPASSACSCAGKSTCSSSHSSGTASKNEVHEGAGILLDEGVDLGLLLGELVHKLLVEGGVRHDSLSQLFEVRVCCQSSQWVRLVDTSIRSVASVVVVGWLRRLLLLSRLSLVSHIGWNSSHQVLESSVGVSESGIESLEALIVALSRNSHEFSDLLLVDVSGRLGRSRTG